MQTGFILSALFLGLLLLFGLALLFVRAEFIERNILVGGATIFTSMVGIGILIYDAQVGYPYGTAGLVSVCCLSVLGFVVSWAIDRLMGPASSPEEPVEATLGSDLAD